LGPDREITKEIQYGDLQTTGVGDSMEGKMTCMGKWGLESERAKGCVGFVLIMTSGYDIKRDASLNWRSS